MLFSVNNYNVEFYLNSLTLFILSHDFVVFYKVASLLNTRYEGAHNCCGKRISAVIGFWHIL